MIGSVKSEASITATVRGNAVLGGVGVGPVTIVHREGIVLEPATRDKLGGVIVGEDLNITEEGILSVDKANSVEGDNTRPITAAAVYTEIGNINALLATI